VNKDSIKYDLEPGKKKYAIATITFAAKKGESFDLKGLRDNLSATRLGKGTRSGVNYLEVTVAGEVTSGAKETVLKVADTKQEFVLSEDSKAKPEKGKKTAYQRLEEALKKGEKIVNVTGRVQGWNGVWPGVLRDLGKAEKTVLVVTAFDVATP
jgi:hypothetical protein